MRALALLSLLLALPATAAVVERFDLPRLVEAAELIVFGEVESTRAAWRGGRIVTTVSLKGITPIKGAAEGPVTVEVLGGALDGLAQKVEGMASFAPGERVAVFLRRSPQGAWQTVGLSQGKLRLEATLAGVQLVRQFDGLALMTQRDGVWQPVDPALPAREGLGAFLAGVQNALKATP